MKKINTTLNLRKKKMKWLKMHPKRKIRKLKELELVLKSMETGTKKEILKQSS